MCNAPTTNYSDVVNWYISMRDMGFKIVQVGHDRKFAAEYMLDMKKAGFRIIDQPQYTINKSQMKKSNIGHIQLKFLYSGIAFD